MEIRRYKNTTHLGDFFYDPKKNGGVAIYIKSAMYVSCDDGFGEDRPHTRLKVNKRDFEKLEEAALSRDLGLCRQLARKVLSKSKRIWD